MKEELGAWNSGDGIDLEGWVSCVGNFSLALGYSTVFWPEFVEFEGYVLRKGFSEKSLREFAKGDEDSTKNVEWVMNHLHIIDIQHWGCKDISVDKVVLLGSVLKEIHEAKLQWQFPEKQFKVEFYEPENRDDLVEYQISFWQEPLA